MRVQDYMTNKDFNIYYGEHRGKVLPARSFVKIIDPKYLPKHILDSQMYKVFDVRIEYVVYCYYGIILISKDYVREA